MASNINPYLYVKNVYKKCDEFPSDDFSACAAPLVNRKISSDRYFKNSHIVFAIVRRWRGYPDRELPGAVDVVATIGASGAEALLSDACVG